MKLRILKLSIYTLIIIVIIYFVYDKLNKKDSSEYAFLSPIPLVQSISNSIGEVLTSRGGLRKSVERALEGSSGTYGIALKNLKTDESYYLNEHKYFDSASLYKLWIMATAYDLIEKGKLKEDEVLTQEIAILNEKFNIASESAEFTEGEISLTVKSAINQMITISHNYAALLLSERIRLASVREYLKSKGFLESKIGTQSTLPTVTPLDIELFFEKLYKGELANQESTQKMIDVLTKQTFKNKLPKTLPEDVLIAHKTGELDYFTHDGGIIFSDKGNYIIVVMSESKFPLGAEGRIADISKNVYEYFTK